MTIDLQALIRQWEAPLDSVRRCSFLLERNLNSFALSLKNLFVFYLLFIDKHLSVNASL